MTPCNFQGLAWSEGMPWVPGPKAGVPLPRSYPRRTATFFRSPGPALAAGVEGIGNQILEARSGDQQHACTVTTTRCDDEELPIVDECPGDPRPLDRAGVRGVRAPVPAWHPWSQAQAADGARLPAMPWARRSAPPPGEMSAL